MTIEASDGVTKVMHMLMVAGKQSTNEMLLDGMARSKCAILALMLHSTGMPVTWRWYVQFWQQNIHSHKTNSRTPTHTRQTNKMQSPGLPGREAGRNEDLGGINSSHDRHGHIHQQHIKLPHSILPYTTFHSIYSFLPIWHHFHSHAQAGQHHLGYSLVDQVVLSQQDHPSLQGSTPDQEQMLYAQ